MDFPDYNDYTAHFAFDRLEHIKSTCLNLITSHNNQDNVNTLSEDYYFDHIKKYMKGKSDETLQERWKDARVAYKEIKKSREEIHSIIKKLRRVKSSRKGKLIEKLIDNSKIWKRNREELIHLWRIIGQRISYLKIPPEERHDYVEPK